MKSLAASALVPMIDVNPLHWLGSQVSESLADTFTSAMMALWSSALWLMNFVFGVLDKFLTPAVDGPGLSRLYGTTMWLSLVVALVVGLGQVALAALRRDGRTLAVVAIGLAQYGAVVAAWIAVCGGLIVGCAGLTKGLLSALLGANGFAGYAVSANMPQYVAGTVQSAVLGLCSIFLVIPAAFGYLLIMLVREAALLVLVATMPIAAAGAMGEGTKAWMWKSIRWFIAACLTSPLLALVVGVGVQISRSAFPDHAVDRASGPLSSAAVVSNETQIGMAVVGCVLFATACFCPMALFRLLAFVDPGTGSGAAFRGALSANGGVSGLLSGGGAHVDGSGAATQIAADGRTQSESGADAATTSRFQSTSTNAFGAAGRVVGKTMELVGGAASAGAAMSIDVMGQAGIGHQGYYDTTPPRRSGKPPPQRTRVGAGLDPGGVANDMDPFGSGHVEMGDVGEIGEDGAMLA